MREKSASVQPSKDAGCTRRKPTPALDHLPIARRSARANDHAAKTLLFEVPLYVIRNRYGSSDIWVIRWGNRPAILWIAKDFGCCA